MGSFIGYILFFLSGILFGLFGAGGSLITIPILMFFFDLSFKISTTYSLIIVFLVSFLGVISSSSSVIYKFKSVLVFGIVSLFGVFFSRNFLFQIASEGLLIKVFISFLFISGLFMLYKKRFQFNASNKKKIFLNHVVLIVQGFLISEITDRFLLFQMSRKFHHPNGLNLNPLVRAKNFVSKIHFCKLQLFRFFRR